MGIIAESPIKNTLLRIKAENGGHHNAIDDDVIARIKQEIPFLTNEDERLYMTLLVYMGLRPEEIYGLQWSDLHLESNYGQIERAVTHPDKSKGYVDTTKTEFSSRTFLITSKPKNKASKRHEATGCHRTNDPIDVNDVLYRLSHATINKMKIWKPGKTWLMAAGWTSCFHDGKPLAFFC